MNKTGVLSLYFFIMTFISGGAGITGAAQAQDLPQAIEEIRAMIKNVETIRQTHRAHTFDHPTLWLCYYGKKGLIPPPHLLNQFIKPEQIEVPGYKVLNEADRKDSFLHSKEVIRRLEKSIAFLEKYADFYNVFPPVFEMDYLRNGLNAWKNHVMSYHNALDQYFTDIALYARYIYYDRNVLYNQRLQELETKYPGRENDEKLQKQFDAEKIKLDAWRQEAEEKGAKLSEQSFNMSTGRTFKAITDHSEIELFCDLEDEFLLRLILFKLNKEYLNSTPAEKTSKRTEQLKLEIEVLKTAAEKKYGKDWKYLFRNIESGALPGGLIHDNQGAAVKSLYFRFFPQTHYHSQQFKTAVRPPDINSCNLCRTFANCEEQGLIKSDASLPAL
ncbi:MAG: hypothetical protein JXD21_00905 [Candidatus Omnitrophica bacterium]|nr:hypothetical protein [Candidatus Omnitrophota bacterium]